MALWTVVAALVLLLAAMVAGGFLALAMGRLHLDLGWGRSRHALGLPTVEIAAPRDLVFEILSAPYTGRAKSDSIELLAGDDSIAVAAHLTKVHFYEARTVEAVELDPPGRIGFRHLTGPVPEAVEEFRVEPAGEGAEIHYEGTLGIDFFWLGRLAARHWVVPQWNRAVADHLADAKATAEQRAERARERKQRESG